MVFDSYFVIKKSRKLCHFVEKYKVESVARHRANILQHLSFIYLAMYRYTDHEVSREL